MNKRDIHFNMSLDGLFAGMDVSSSSFSLLRSFVCDSSIALCVLVIVSTNIPTDSFQSEQEIFFIFFIASPYLQRTFNLSETEGVFNGLDTCMHVLTIYDPTPKIAIGSKEEKLIRRKKSEKQHKGLEMSD